MSVKNFENQHELLIQQIAETIQEADLTKDVTREELFNIVTYYVDVLGIEADEIVPREIARHYFQGYDDGARRLNIDARTLDSNGNFTANANKQIHVEKIENIIDDTLIDLKAAYRTFELNAIQNIEQSLNEIKGGILSTQFGNLQANKAAAKRILVESFLSKGITSFVTKDGKNLPLDFYVSTVLETKIAQADVQGHLTRYNESEVDLVEISARPGTCGVCGQYDGLVYALGDHPDYPTYPQDLIPFHPHCKCTIYPIIEEFLTPTELNEIKQRQAKGLVDTRSEREKHLYETEQATKRKHNQDKKLYSRMKSYIPDAVPDTLLKFKNLKEKGTKDYKDIYSLYLSERRKQ